MRFLYLITIAFICFAGDPPTPQPVEVQSALAAYEKAVVQARKAYDVAEAKIRGDAVAALQKAQEGYLKKGDLDGAVLVKEAAKKLNSGETLVVVEENLRRVQDLLGGAPTIVGKWKYKRPGFEVTFTINADGTVIPSNTGTVGKWKEEAGGIRLIWPGGTAYNKFLFPLSEAKTICDDSDTGPRSATATKIK